MTFKDRFRASILVVSLAVWGYVYPSPLCAAVKTPVSDIEVTAKKMVAKMINNGVELTFDGRVKVKQDDMSLTCDKLVGFYEEDGKGKGGEKGHGATAMASSVKSATAIGNVKITKGEIRAEAGKAVLDNVHRTATLTEGPPVVRQGPHMLSAPTIIIYLDENRAELLGDITATINPGKTKKEKDK